MSEPTDETERHGGSEDDDWREGPWTCICGSLHALRPHAPIRGCLVSDHPQEIEVGTPVYGVTTEGKPIAWRVTHVDEDDTITVGPDDRDLPQ